MNRGSRVSCRLGLLLAVLASCSTDKHDCEAYAEKATALTADGAVDPEDHARSMRALSLDECRRGEVNREKFDCVMKASTDVEFWACFPTVLAAPRVPEEPAVVAVAGAGQEIQRMVIAGHHVYWIEGTGDGPSTLMHVKDDTRRTDRGIVDRSAVTGDALAASWRYAYFTGPSGELMRRDHRGREAEIVATQRGLVELATAKDVVFGVERISSAEVGVAGNRDRLWRIAPDEQPVVILSAAEISDLFAHADRLSMSLRKHDGAAVETVSVDFLGQDMRARLAGPPWDEGDVIGFDDRHAYAVLPGKQGIVAIDRTTEARSDLWPATGVSVQRGWAGRLYIHLRDRIVRLEFPAR